mgnify:CR=1 FL=1
MGFIIFATLFISVFTLLSFYISKRFINRLDFKKKTKNKLNIFLIFNFIGVLLYLSSRYMISVPNYLNFLFSISIGIIFLLFLTTLFYDIFHFLINRTTLNENRRNFFKKTLDIGGMTLASAITASATYGAKDITIEKVAIKIKDLKKEYKIVQLSDIHIGGLIGEDFITSVVKTVNDLNPDIVVITGDLIDTKLSYIKDSIYELTNLKSTYGTYFIVGNHEYFHGLKQIIEHINSLGIKVLENENVYIGEKDKGFYLAGVYDVIGYRIEQYQPDLKKALEGINDAPTVLLAHQPKFINEVPNSVDLMLSGHTHGGQIVPFNFLVKLAQPYIKGLHKHNENTQVYVNRGTGFWGPPMRLGASAEITEITLKGN